MEKIKELVLKLYEKYRNFILYGIIGVSGATIDYLLFLLFVDKFSWNVLLANLLSVSCGIINNFIWNVIFNFKTKDHLFIRFVSFYSIGLLGLGISTIILKIFVDNLGYSAAIVKLASIVVVVIIQYFLNKYISFRKSKRINLEESSL
jgi:putative flippase GtrA